MKKLKTYRQTIGKKRQTHALELARTIAGEDAIVAIHNGSSKANVAIRISGCWPETAKRIGAELRDQLNAEIIGNDGYMEQYNNQVAKLVTNAGFVAVWL